jgi:hypothetical protein
VPFIIDLYAALPLVGKGAFEAWNSIDFFNDVRVDPKSNTVAWGEDIDLDAYVLRQKSKLRKSLVTNHKLEMILMNSLEFIRSIK